MNYYEKVYGCKVEYTPNKVKEENPELLAIAESQKLLDITNPISKVTGWRTNDLTMLMSDKVSQKVKDVILNNLTAVPSGSAPNSLSDEDLIENTPSRYLGNRVEVDAVAKGVEMYINANNAAETETTAE